MIISASKRTDIPSYYSDWFIDRLKENVVFIPNPRNPNRMGKALLTPENVDCIIFWTKNPIPRLDKLNVIEDMGYQFYFQFTLTPYGKDVEKHLPSKEMLIQTFIDLSKKLGKHCVLWRYDPILLTSKYTVAKHLETYEYMAKKLTGHIDRCIFSFVEMYSKHKTNFPELIPLKKEDMEQIAEGLGKIAKKYDILLQTCGPEEDYARYDIHTSSCVTLDILGKANDLEFRKLKHKGFREGCHCIESRDIGMLNSCPNGCKYCYANKNHEITIANYKKHNPKSPLLIGYVNEDDDVQQGVQRTFLTKQYS